MHVKRYAIAVAMFAAMLATAALPASAQTYKATFTLDAPAQWGSAMLAPGEYTIEAGQIPHNQMIFVRGSNGAAAIVSAMYVESREVGGRHGELELTQVNGTNVVTKLSASLAGKVYTFGIPKSVRVSPAQAGTVALKRVVIPVN